MDRISNLPEDIVHHIVSLLSSKEAAFVKTLSKNWLNLITIESDCVFDQSSIHNIEGGFNLFVDGLVAKPASHRIRRFVLKITDVDDSQYQLVNDCLRNVLKRGVMDLEIDINVRNDYSLPVEVFTCETVVKMKLGPCFVIDNVPKNALLPGLKTLLLDSILFYGDGSAFEKLLSICHVLEELVILRFKGERWNWSRIVSSETLKRLTIRRGYLEEEGYEGSDYETISFDTPSLAYLEYADVIQNEFPVVNLNSLVEAKLNLTMYTIRDNCGYDFSNLFKGLKNVQTLSFDFVDTAMLFEDSDIVPVFENMSHLVIPTEPGFCWYALKVLLKKSPNLKTLTIQDLHYSYFNTDHDVNSVCECLEGYSFLSSCRFETLKITNFRGAIDEMVQLQNILQNLPYLELLEVHVLANGDDAKLEIMEDLLMFPRASTKCQIKCLFVNG